MNIIHKFHKDLQKYIHSDTEGIMYILHPNYNIEIEDISKFSVDEINELFIKHKNIEEKTKKIHKDLRKFVIKNNVAIVSSINHYEFELNDISKYTPEDIYEKFLIQQRKLIDLLNHGDFEKYIFSLPKSSRLNGFQKLTTLPPKGSINYYKLNGKVIWNLNDKEYWEFSRLLWNNYSDLGCNSSNDNWWNILQNNRKTGSQYFMTSEENNYLDNLPEEITVFRGFIASKNINDEIHLKKITNNLYDKIGRNPWFSFTLSENVGLKYMKKYQSYNQIYKDGNKMESEIFEGKIKKEIVFGYLNHNKEQEILIIPKNSNF